LSAVADHAVEVTAAGRTDAGVHALMQVGHFDSAAPRAPRAWVLGSNTELPAEISVLWARSVPERFHARYSALSRTYVYRIVNQSCRPALLRGQACWVRRSLDAGAMHSAAQVLLGEHDFSSFRAAECQSASAVRRMMHIAVERREASVVITVRANAFLHHMIRNIMGCLVTVGQGSQPPEWVAEVLQARSRKVAAPTFSPDGLYFLGPVYADSWGLPSRTAAYDWLP